MCGDINYAPAAPLIWNERLAQASLRHSQDMATRNFFSHDGSDRSDPVDRMTAAGYQGSSFAENIAGGQKNIAAVMRDWMASPDHCQNIMNPAYRDMGAACVKSVTTSRYATYWTQDFGAP